MDVGAQAVHGSTAVTRPDDGSYPAIFAGYFASMVRLAALLGADDPENIAQEAFVQLHLHQDRLRDVAAARAYLRTTVTNLTRKRHRHLRVVHRHRTAAETVGVSAEEAAFRTGADERVLQALRDLPPRQREAIVLRYWLDLGEQDVADTMRVTVGSVKAHVSRGLAVLRAVLTDVGGSAR